MLNNTSPVANPRVWTLPPREQPIHRVAETPAGCNLVELLAALIGGKNQIEAAEALLEKYESLQSICRASVDEISSIPGIGHQTAARLVSALELGRRLAIEAEDNRPFIYTVHDAAKLIRTEMRLLEQEELWVLVLDVRCRLICIDKLYRGSVCSAQIRTGELFKTAVRRMGSSIIVAHNHPSGDSSPSPEDISLTKLITQAGKLLDISVMDHIVIGSNKFTSIREGNHSICW